MPTTWDERLRPTTDWGIRVRPNTSWWERSRPETSWGERWSVETSWDGRVRPITYMTPLEDAYTEVADEEDQVIFILANEWKLIPATFWKTRPAI